MADIDVSVDARFKYVLDAMQAQTASMHTKYDELNKEHQAHLAQRDHRLQMIEDAMETRRAVDQASMKRYVTEVDLSIYIYIYIDVRSLVDISGYCIDPTLIDIYIYIYIVSMPCRRSSNTGQA